MTERQDRAGQPTSPVSTPARRRAGQSSAWNRPMSRMPARGKLFLRNLLGRRGWRCR